MTKRGGRHRQGVGTGVTTSAPDTAAKPDAEQEKTKGTVTSWRRKEAEITGVRSESEHQRLGTHCGEVVSERK